MNSIPIQTIIHQQQEEGTALISRESGQKSDIFDPGTRVAALTVLNKHGVQGVPQLYRTELDGEWNDEIKTRQLRRKVFIEKVEGESLDEYFGGDIAMEEEVLEILTQVARISADMLDVGVYHGDIKPPNIMINKNGLITLVDFDCALVDAQSNPNPQTPYKGTHYMIYGSYTLGTRNILSPERLNQKAAIDGRSEIYSIAKTGLFLLLGDRNRNKITDWENITLKEIENILGYSDSKLVKLLFTNISFDPEDRTPTIREFQHKLEELSKKLGYNNNNAT